MEWNIGDKVRFLGRRSVWEIISITPEGLFQVRAINGCATRHNVSHERLEKA